MTLRAWVWLLRREVLAGKLRLLLLILCVGICGFLAGLAFTVFWFLHREAGPRLEQMFPEKRVILRPASNDLLLLRFETSQITGETITNFREMPEVDAVYPQMPATFPVSANLDFPQFDVGLATDVILFGVPRDLVADELPEDAPFRYQPGKPVPVLLSSYFIDVYNMGLADSMGTPKLSPRAAIGLEFDLLLGESSLDLAPPGKKPRTVRGRLAGYTANPSLIGLSVPLPALREWNAEYSTKARPRYTALHLDLRDVEDLEAVEARAQEANLRVEAQRDELRRYQKILWTIEGVLTGGLAMILALAGVGIFSVMGQAVGERLPVWGLHRATGLGPRGVLVLASSHALVVATSSGVFATAGVWGVCELLGSLTVERLRVVTLLEANPFAFSPVTAGVIFGLCGALAFLPAWLFALPGIKSAPVDLLARREL